MNIRTPLGLSFLYANLFALALFLPISVFAQGAAPSGTLSVEPSKIESEVKSGETIRTNFRVTNTTPVPLSLSIGFEDVSPNDVLSNDAQPAILLGEKEGVYPLKDLVRIPEAKVILLTGESKNISVDISVPKNARPGGRYGSAVITARPATDLSGNKDQNISIGTRIAVLYFVRVPGEVTESGALQKFSLFNDQKFVVSPSREDPLLLQVAFENTGNVHLNPYGKITLRTWLRTPIQKILEPWAVYPKVTRLSEVAIVEDLMPGYYTATIELNRGYSDMIDTRSVTFVVLPGVKTISLLVILFVFGVLLFLRSMRLSKNFTTS